MLAYKGTTTPGFRNFVMMTGPNTGLGHNSMAFTIESQVAHALDCLRVLRERGAHVFEGVAADRFRTDAAGVAEVPGTRRCGRASRGAFDPEAYEPAA